MERRTLLTGLGGLAATAAIGGCLSAPAGNDRTLTDPTSGEHPVTPTETSFTVDDRSCGQGEHAATVAFDDGTVTVDGVIGGRDTCDTAELAGATIDAGTLTVTVALIEEPRTGTPACGQCLTDIEYTASVGGLGDAVSRVRVVHRTADGGQTVTVAERQ